MNLDRGSLVSGSRDDAFRSLTYIEEGEEEEEARSHGEVECIFPRK